MRDGTGDGAGDGTADRADGTEGMDGAMGDGTGEPRVRPPGRARRLRRFRPRPASRRAQPPEDRPPEPQHRPPGPPQPQQPLPSHQQHQTHQPHRPHQPHPPQEASPSPAGPEPGSTPDSGPAGREERARRFGGPRPPRHFVDAEAGPVVRPYAMTRGRTSSTSQHHRLDLIALVVPGPAAGTTGHGHHLSPEHVDIVERSERSPQSIAELAAGLDLPVGVIRVLVGDLVEDELVQVTRPVPPAELPDVNILREVINGLRAL